MKRYRLGIVPYLNGRPLIWGLEKHYDLRVAPPAELTKLLDRGIIDAGIMPSLYLFSHPKAVPVPSLCIGAEGEVASVLLFHKNNLEQAQMLAGDAESLTSVALARVVLADAYGCRPMLSRMPADLEKMLSFADAAVLIGDKAMRARLADSRSYLDLGEAWFSLTGLPFVFALWVAADRQTRDALAAPLSEALCEGREHLEEIALDHSARSGLPAAECLRYLRERVRYDFGPKEKQGLEQFRKRCESLGIV